MKHAVMALVVCATLLGFMSCSDPITAAVTPPSGTTLDFADFLDQYHFSKIESGYAFEGDVAFSEAEVAKLYVNECVARAASATKGNIAINAYRNRYLWSFSERHNLTYRFATNMATPSLSDAQVRAAFCEAAQAWMNRADVTLTESSNAVFVVRTVNVSDGYNAISFFPHANYEYALSINLRYVNSTYNTYARMVGLFTHELGHSLGLAHEHQRADAPNHFGQGVFGEPHGPYDAASVMHYGNQPYVGGISAGDIGTIGAMYALGSGVTYQPHCESDGWLPYAYNGAVAGTTGLSKRMEAIKIELFNMPAGASIQYRAHCQGIGWMSWVADGATAGTTGQSRRLEAIQIYVTRN